MSVPELFRFDDRTSVPEFIASTWVRKWIITPFKALHSLQQEWLGFPEGKVEVVGVDDKFAYQVLVVQPVNALIQYSFSVVFCWPKKEIGSPFSLLWLYSFHL